jgi:hypothetical protein
LPGANSTATLDNFVRDALATALHDGRELGAVVSAEAKIGLGLAAGVLALDDVAGVVDIEGDEAATRASFEAPANPTRDAALDRGTMDR